jgi:16S rRNA (guanine1207-N2)-methyltransferase
VSQAASLSVPTDIVIGQPPGPDAVDRIILRELAGARLGPGPVVVVDDESGALALGVAAARPGQPVRAWCDSLRAERAVQTTLVAVGQPGDAAGDSDVFAGAVAVALRLPKSLAALAETAGRVAQTADPSVVVLAGGRNKHLTRGMNAVLERHFGSVRASLGQQNSRVLLASDPIPGRPPPPPRSQEHPDLGITLTAFGGVFAGTSVDPGSRFLVSLLDRIPQEVREAVDLGCGTGLLAVAVARARPRCQVLAVDDSRDAVRSAIATAVANGLEDRVRIERADGLEGVGARSVDLIVCNPPFHHQTTRDSAVAYAMFADAGRCLRAGGELWTVFNSHLPYLTALRRLVGRTSVIGQNPRYTVARSVRTARR